MILARALEVGCLALELLHGRLNQTLTAALERAGIMLRPIAQDRRLLDALQVLRDSGELLRHLAKFRPIVGRWPDFLEPIQGQFNALADIGHFPREIAG